MAESLKQFETLETLVRHFYDSIVKANDLPYTELSDNQTKFFLNENKELCLRKFPQVSLKKGDGSAYALSTLTTKLGGITDICNMLGFTSHNT